MILSVLYTHLVTPETQSRPPCTAYTQNSGLLVSCIQQTAKSAGIQGYKFLCIRGRVTIIRTHES